MTKTTTVTKTMTKTTNKPLQTKKPATKKASAAPKSTATKSTAKAAKGGSFVVSSCASYRADGFHAYQEPDWKVDSTHATAKAANNRVRALFRKQSPYGADTLKELTEQGIVDETQDRQGLLTMSIAPEDSQEWTVTAKAAK